MDKLNVHYLKPKEAATFLKISPSSLARWRHEGHGPRYSKLDTGSILYDEADLIDYVCRRKIKLVH